MDVANIVFRNITRENFSIVAEIYTDGLSTGMATFETEVPSWEKWDCGHKKIGRVIAYYNNNPIGWAALSSVSNRKVYQGVAEVSVYVSKQYHGNGVGKRLLDKLIEVSEINQIWTLQSSIFSQNAGSIQLHKKCGFREIGYRERIAQRYGIWYDNVLMERRSDRVGVN